MGRLKSSTEIPKDAIPEIHVPSFIESFFGGPVVAKQKFLPADRMVSSLQIGAVLLDYSVFPNSRNYTGFWNCMVRSIEYLGNRFTGWTFPSL